MLSRHLIILTHEPSHIGLNRYRFLFTLYPLRREARHIQQTNNPF